ncbi:hypothetical protein NS365_07165 [Aureimonas ureilytica]|uniref:Uncharacterized protein n=1 Tax=Aureimonas ureilytica TaxID=401562 RepID=A0A175R968_9HYPH|nr:hypothetical protein [Aureimonas ureilytica]KTQ95179.1 hypothetical protein NS226_13470 [Aureimonas ureilytica]KTR06642.1 hypothetical protein NS365_07165 [Aureimonas ureilytica]
MVRPFAASLALLVLSGASAPVSAADKDEAFFQNVFGRWSGPGEIVAGKYKGTKFVCDLTGAKPMKDVGMSLDGSCRVGMFSQPMSATFIKGGSSYKGSFLDGSAGKGLDIVSGDVAGDKITVGLDRKQLKGAMVARIDGKDKLNVTISVQVANELVPVIGMHLKRDETVKRASID